MSLFVRFELDPNIQLDAITRTILFDESLAQNELWSPPTARAEALGMMTIKLSSVLNSGVFSSGVQELIDALNQTTAKTIKWGSRRGEKLMAIAFIDVENETLIGAASWDYYTGNEKHWDRERA